MAKFHHAFLSIHPFTDGNGALARTLLSMQLQNLLGISKAVIFDDRQQYFDALRCADAGDLTMLEGLIRELTESIGLKLPRWSRCRTGEFCEVREYGLY